MVHSVLGWIAVAVGCWSLSFGFLNLVERFDRSDGGVMMIDVKGLRERFGLTREQFCEGFEIPYRTLQSWELGSRRCPVYVFRMMEVILELSERSGGLDAFKRGDTK